MMEQDQLRRDLLSNSSPLLLARSTSVKKREVSSFAQRFMRDDSVRPDSISTDHCYSKNWNSQSDQSHAQTAKYISWLNSESRKTSRSVDNDEIVDIEGIDSSVESQFNDDQANDLMTECERHMKTVRPAVTFHADEPIDRSEWNAAQNKVFNRVYKALASERLSKLANAGTVNEPILRRLHVDKSAKRIRHIFSSACWDHSLLSWLHSTCMDYLPNSMLSDYLEVLQTLKVKVPELIDRIITGSEHHQRMNTLQNEALELLIKRPWDPITAMPSLTKLEKLPKNPLLILVPQLGLTNAKSSGSAGKHRRHEMWQTQLGNMGRVLIVPPPDLSKVTDRWEQFDTLVGITKGCIMQAKEMYPGKPIILFGWNFGALLAIYVSSIQRVNAVIALGYPLLGLSGLRGDADDVTVDSTTPILFVVGEHAQTCPIDDLENMRERMRAENELIVVAGANDKLNINFKTKKDRLLTQAIVDRCIQEEIRSYLERLLTASTQLIPTMSLSTIDRFKKKKSQALNISTRKIITTIKRVENSVTSVPKKRKSPSKESRMRKQMKRSNVFPSEQEQLAAISSITPSNNDPLNMSSSSQGSLTSLQPHRIQLPSISASSDNVIGGPEQSTTKKKPVRSTYQGYRLDLPPVRQFSAQLNKKTNAQGSASFPSYIHVSGQRTGKGVVISMEKAKELLSKGLLRNYSTSQTVNERLMKSPDMTRRSFSLPLGSPIGFPIATGPIAGAAVATDSIASTMPQVRHLLKSDGRLFLSGSKKPALTKSLSTSAPAKENAALPISQSHSSGQSLIKKLQNSTTSTSTSCRPILAKPQETSLKHSISVVLNSSNSCAGTTTVASITSSAVIISPNTKSYPHLTSAAVSKQVKESNTLAAMVNDINPRHNSTFSEQTFEQSDQNNTALLSLEEGDDSSLEVFTRTPVEVSPVSKEKPINQKAYSLLKDEIPTAKMPKHEAQQLPQTMGTASNVSSSRSSVHSKDSFTDANEEPTTLTATHSFDKQGTLPLVAYTKPSTKLEANVSKDITLRVLVRARTESSAPSTTPCAEGECHVAEKPKELIPFQNTKEIFDEKKSINCDDNQLKEVLSPGGFPPISAHSSQYLADVDFSPHIVQDIIVPATSMFNPENEDGQEVTHIITRQEHDGA